jgi:aspartate/methionine/tyrosine aminotransferase
MAEYALGTFLARWYPATRHDLAASESETWRISDLLALASPADLARWDHLALGYTDPRGAVWLRERIALGYDRIDADHLIGFAGAQEGLRLTVDAILTPADHAIIVLPVYQPCELTLTDVCETTGVALDPHRGWALDVEAVRAAIRPNTRLVFINFPNNPTGKLIDTGTLGALIALCREHGLWLVNDEVYRLIDRDPSRRLPCVADAYERGISIDAVSKSLGLPGLRIGWLACQDAAFNARVNHLKQVASMCLSAPSEVLGDIALGARERLLARNRAIADDNLAVLDSFIADHADLLRWHRPDGGVVGYVQYRGDVEAFAISMAREAGVLVLPSSVWASALVELPKDHFRIGFGRLGCSEGIEILAATLKQRIAA